MIIRSGYFIPPARPDYPKPIVQGQGGILLAHLESLALEHDLKPADKFFWFTTTGWMIWNLITSGLLVCATVLLYDGSPAYPDIGTLWKFAQDSGMTFFGTSAGFITSCMKAGRLAVLRFFIEPGKAYDLSKLRGLGSTGSPLPPEGFQWVYDHVKRDIWLGSMSGGTDVCSAFVGGSVLLPVYAGELQCRSLGAKVESFDEQGHPLIGEVGELVITEPLPSMPLYFWTTPKANATRRATLACIPAYGAMATGFRLPPEAVLSSLVVLTPPSTGRVSEWAPVKSTAS